MAKKPRPKNKKKMSQGGKLVGPSHEQGGIQGVVDGSEPIEVEGGEFIINKESAAALGDNFLHKLNATGTNMNGPNGFQAGQLGNGSNYQSGGRVNGNGNGNNSPQQIKYNRTNKSYGTHVKGIIKGVTTENDGHVHQYLILPNGTVHILPAYHPKTKQIHHTHEYMGGLFPGGNITQNQSECHPNCKDRYGYDGVGAHSHQILSTPDRPAKAIRNKRTKKLIGNRFSSRSRRTRLAGKRRNSRRNS